MKLRSIGVTAAVVGLAATAVAPSANAHSAPGSRSLAQVLTSDGNRFDRNWNDYDIVTEAVLAVLDAKPTSDVRLLADGGTALTAFIPDDRAFRVLVADISGRWPTSERKVFDAVAGLGIDTVETVLLYHVVPGKAITKKAAVRANGATLTTAQGGTIGVRVKSKSRAKVELRDQDRNDRNPFLDRGALDINKGNAQIAHGITLVLRPVNL